MLNRRQQRFASEYCVDLHATKAAIRAGYSAKTAYSMAHKLLKNGEIAAQIAQSQAKALDNAELSATRVLEEMRRLGFSNVQALFDANGDLRPLHTLTQEQAACISSIEVVMKNAAAGDGKIDRILRIRLWDKRATLEMLGKHFALLTERVQVEASAELLEALLAGRARAAAAKGEGL